jgi:hypothetical protein
MNVILSFEGSTNIHEDTLFNVCCISNILFIFFLRSFILFNTYMQILVQLQCIHVTMLYANYMTPFNI